MTTSRQPKGIPVGGQFAAQAHQEAGIALATGTPSRPDFIENLGQFDADTRAQKRALHEASLEIDRSRGQVGAALAALELKKAFPTSGAIRFDRISTQGQGIAVNPEVLEDNGTRLYRNGPFDSMLSAPSEVREPLERAMTHLSSVRDEDLEAQGFKKVELPTGTSYELNFENALALAERRGVPGGQDQPLDLSIPAKDGMRRLGPSEHGLADVETLTITNLGANANYPDRNVISLEYTLPASANIREMYDSGDWSETQAYWAARSAVADLLGCKEFAEIDINGLPENSIILDSEGNITLRMYDYFRPGESIDPEDLQSWTADLSQFSDPEVRVRLESAITERYFED